MTPEQRAVWSRQWFALPWSTTGESAPDLSQVRICDSTLREGLDEGASVYPNTPSWDDVLRLAHRIEKLNLDAVEVPGPDFLTREKLEELYSCFERTPISVKIVFKASDVERSMARVDEAVALGADILTNDDAGSSDFYLEVHGGISGLTDSLARLVSHGKSAGARFHATTSDAFRAPVDRLIALGSEVVAAGADAFGLKDTFGLAMPSQTQRLIEVLRRALPSTPLEIHCHDDFGLGLANNLAAAEAGAVWLDGCLNGLGDRAGHTSLEQLLLVLELSYGVDTGVDLHALREVSLLVQEITGLVHPTTPLVGPKIFNEARGRHLIHPILMKLALSRGATGKLSPENVWEKADALVNRSDGTTLDESWIEAWLDDVPSEEPV